MKFFEETYSYDQLISDCASLTRKFSGCESTNICTTESGRKILKLTLGNGSNHILYIGAHHGREYITSAFLMGMCEHMLRLYKMLDPITTEFFKNNTLHVIPMLNPDGVSIALSGAAGEKNRGFIEDILPIPHSLYKANGNGVDLNRNYPCLFDQVKSPPSPSYAGYKGPYAGSEVEVRAVISLCSAFPFSYALTFHAFGEEILYGDFHSGDIPYAFYMAEKVGCYSGFVTMPPTQTAENFGGFENYFRAQYLRPCLLMELGHGLNEGLYCLNTDKYRRLYALPLIVSSALKGVAI